MTSERCGCELREEHFLAGLVVGETEENASELQFPIFKLGSLLGQSHFYPLVSGKAKVSKYRHKDIQPVQTEVG